ncbi:hypothetical protein PILCRDRAFT_693808 [Piloderma croceum F 1598]|uniref:Uncharacterized protein n=1 Tax=Piloderma croceum (strain F 1598) TaxID=765440 RepID=A0A0C3F4H3_PILCF|nr:hypothetical protein PILCRDRAFT_693808 [Piloderma croceum F 1598]
MDCECRDVGFAEAPSTRSVAISIISIAAVIPSWSTIIMTTSVHEGHWTIQDPESHTQVVADCKPARIMSTTTFRTTNVCIVPSYFANLDIYIKPLGSFKRLNLNRRKVCSRFAILLRVRGI